MLISFFLFYRNKQYDRAVAPFFFILALSSLVLYGYHSQADSSQVGSALLLLSFLQLLALALGIYFTSSSTIQRIAGAFVTICGLLTAAVLFYTLSGNDIVMNKEQGLMINNQNRGTLFSSIYLLLLTSLLLLLNFQYKWSSVTLSLFMLLVVAAGGYFFGNQLIIRFPTISVLLCLVTWGSSIEI